MKKILFCILGLLTFVSCSGTTKEHTPILDKNQSIYIMLPDVSDGAQTHLVQEELRKNFTKLSAAKVSTALDQSSIKTGFMEAKKQKADLLVCPMIINWRDTDNSSGLRDKIGINIRIFDVKTQETINEQNLYKNGKMISFAESSPDKLLAGIIKRYVVLLYK